MYESWKPVEPPDATSFQGKKEDAGVRNGRKAAIHCVFPLIYGSGGSTSRLALAAGVKPSGQMRDKRLHAIVARSIDRFKTLLEVEMLKKCTTLWHEARVAVKMYEAQHSERFWTLRY